MEEVAGQHLGAVWWGHTQLPCPLLGSGYATSSHNNVFTSLEAALSFSVQTFY